MELDLTEDGGARLLDILADRVYAENNHTRRLQLEPYGYRWLRLDGGR